MFIPNETPLRSLNRSRLNEAEAEFYDSICRAITTNEGYVPLDAEVSSISYESVIEAVLFDSFEIFKLDRVRPFSVPEEGDLRLELNYSYGLEQSLEIQRMVDMAAERIVDRCLESCSTDFEKEEFVHNYLADTVTYTHETHMDDLTEHTCVGALLERKAVCEGIAKTAALLLNRLGVDCGCVVNDTHMWNIIRLDDEYYHLDITWDLRRKFRTMDYFNVDDRWIMDDHPCHYGPICDGRKYNWYRHHGMIFSSLEGIYDTVSGLGETGAFHLGLRYERLADEDAVYTAYQALRDVGLKGRYVVFQDKKKNILHVVREEL